MKGQRNRPELGSSQRSVASLGLSQVICIFPGRVVKDHLQIPHTTRGCSEIKQYQQCVSIVQSPHYPGKEAWSLPPTRVTEV